MPINLHRTFIRMRPDKIVVYSKTEVKPLKLPDNQKKYDTAHKNLDKMDDWRFLELYKDGEVIKVITWEDVHGESNGSDLGEHETVLKLLVENNERLGQLFDNMYGNMIDGYAELAATAVQHATEARKEEFSALRKLAKLSDGANGETNWVELIQHAPKILEIFKSLSSSGGNAAAIKSEFEKIKDLAEKMGFE